MLTVQKVSGGYSGESVLKDISFTVNKGELLGILGPNGSGKTTLLKMLSGILPIQQGEIKIKGKGLKDYGTKQLAQIVAVLSQHSSQSFSYTVKETVSLGRYAHQVGWFQAWSKTDEEIVQRVMNQTGISSFQHKNIMELSGGERQRVFLAQALAQQPEILLLDEPTNHLDLSYQKELLDLLKKWTTENGLTVISIFHDLNLAGLYCDQLLLLDKGTVHINSYPNDVLREERIRDVYHTEIQKHPHPKVPAPQIVLLPEMKKAENHFVINESMVEVSNDFMMVKTPMPLRTMSSGVIGSGTGWKQTFINRHVSKNDHCMDPRTEMVSFLKSKGFDPSETVGMMTTVQPEDVVHGLYEEDDFSIFVVVTADAGDAMTSSKSEQVRGAIHTWVFVNGELTEDAFVQSIMTATESKVRAILDLNVLGTSTDSILIASSQTGKLLEYAGSISPLGKLISEAVYQCTTAAITKSIMRNLSIRLFS